MKEKGEMGAAQCKLNKAHCERTHNTWIKFAAFGKTFRVQNVMRKSGGGGGGGHQQLDPLMVTKATISLTPTPSRPGYRAGHKFH